MRYGFDRFELNTTHFTIESEGIPLAADARIVKLMSLLIEARPEYCDRKFLLEQLWPTTIVAHWSLARLVSDARKLFKEAGYAGPVIQTLHGRGYRLAPELAAQLRLVDPSVAPDAVSSRSRYARASRRWWPLLLVPLVAALSFHVAQQMQDDELTIGEATDVIGRVLWVDDHPENNLEERRFLESRRIAVYTVTSTEEALTLLSLYHYDAVISDMGRGEESLAGVKLLQAMRARQDETPFFMYTILPSAAQGKLVRDTGGQGVAVTSDELYTLVLLVFDLPFSGR